MAVRIESTEKFLLTSLTSHLATSSYFYCLREQEEKESICLLLIQWVCPFHSIGFTRNKSFRLFCLIAIGIHKLIYRRWQEVRQLKYKLQIIFWIVTSFNEVHRIGQQKKVHIYRLISADSVEERIVQRAQKKVFCYLNCEISTS